MSGGDWWYVAFLGFLVVALAIFAVGSFIACGHGVVVEGVCNP